MRGFIKYIILFIVACVCSIGIYYMIVPEERQTPISIEMTQ